MNTAAADLSKRWMPFQCPSCFALFRLQRFMTGRRGNCPTCKMLIQIPLIEASTPAPVAMPEIAPPPIPEQPKNDSALLGKVAMAQPMTEAEKADRESRKSDRRKQLPGAAAEDLHWEKNESSKKGGVSWVMVSVVAMMVTLLGAVGVYVAKNAPKDKATGVVSGTLGSESQSILDQSLEEEGNSIYKDEDGVDTAVEAVDQYSNFDLMEIEKTIKAFLQAKTVTERIALSRHPKRVGPLMKKFYGAEKIEPEGFDSMNKTEVSYREDFMTAIIKTADFLSSPIAVQLIKGEDGAEDRYVIDWESWIGHSEMRPEELHKHRPEKPFRMRVIVRPESYYNFSFSDDKKWRSYRLEFRDGAYSFLGYVRRNSETDKGFVDLLKTGRSAPYIIMARYPPKARAKNQIEITSIVSDGWIFETDEEKKAAEKGDDSKD